MDPTLGIKAAELAMHGAVNWMRSNGHAKADKATLDRLVVVLREKTKAALSTALDDARNALACNMGTVAEYTFSASMTLAGIASAKEIFAK